MIIPSIDIQSGRAVQLRQGREFVLDGGDPMERLDEFSIAGVVAVIDLDAAMGTGSNRGLIHEMCRRRPIRVGGGIRSHDEAVWWLDAGAEHIIIGTAATEAFCGALPRDRVIAAVDAVRGEVVVEGWQTKTGDSALKRIERLSSVVSGFLLTQVEWEGRLAGFDTELILSAIEVAGDARITAAGGIRSASDIADLDALGVDAQVGMALYSGKMTLGESVTAVLKKPISDRFWPTVVVDEAGVLLGLVWSTTESIEVAVRERRGVYWSRSRDSLWRKGETSGNTQQLLSVSVDCDRDALRFVVRQAGAFCHTGSHTCFGTDFNLERLETTLRDRREDADPTSGTFRLLSDPPLLQEKLLEEARELSVASQSVDVVHEAADLLYFLLVALVRSGDSFSDVIDELRRRSLRVQRRPMVSKRSDDKSTRSEPDFQDAHFGKSPEARP